MLNKVNINNKSIQEHIHSEIVKEIRKGNLKNDHYITGWFYISIKSILHWVIVVFCYVGWNKKVRKNISHE